MSSNNHKSPVSSAVMEQINSGSVRMKPRAYFVLLSALSAAAVLFAGLAMAYLWSIVWFWIRIQTATTPARGARANLAEAVAAFPWWAVFASVLLLAISVILMRRQGHLYRYRIVTIALVFLFCTLIVGATLSAFDIGRSHTPQRLEQSSPSGSNGKQLKRNNSQKEAP